MTNYESLCNLTAIARRGIQRSYYACSTDFYEYSALQSRRKEEHGYRYTTPVGFYVETSAYG